MDVQACYRNILAELKRLQAPGAWDPDTSIPGLISAGLGGSIAVNGAIEKDIRAIADWVLDQRPVAKKQHTLKEWRARVRQAFGPALMQIDLDQSVVDSGRELRKLVEATIGSAPGTIPLMFTSIGCRFFDRPLATSLSIGPVLFEPKAEWLTRAAKIGQIKHKTQKRLERAFGGSTLRKLKNTQQDLFDRQFAEVLGKSQMVCTIETRGLASELSQARAITGARLGQTAVALMWSRPSTALEGFHLSVDHGPRYVEAVPYIPGSFMIGGSRLVGMPTGRPKDWDSVLSDARGLLDTAGQMIACWTSATDYDKASPVLRNLAQALFFFWQACKEEDALMAIVKFTAALEALSGKSAAIVKLAKARLGIKAGAKVTGDRDIDQVVEWIYSAARSRTLHGTNTDILHDWSDARAIAESLTRHCLVASMDWLGQNPGASDKKALLS
jgi:hypothetical protein